MKPTTKPQMVKISKKESAELEKIRNDIRKGNFVSEKDLFSILSK